MIELFTKNESAFETMENTFGEKMRYFTKVSFGENKLDLNKKVHLGATKDNSWKTEVDVLWDDDVLFCLGTQTDSDKETKDKNNIPEALQEIVVVAASCVRQNELYKHGVLYMPVWVSHAGVFISPKDFVDNNQKNLTGGLKEWYKKFYAQYDRLIPAKTFSFVLCEENNTKEFCKMIVDKWSKELQETIATLMVNIETEFSL